MDICELTVRPMDGSAELHGCTCCVSVSERHDEAITVNVTDTFFAVGRSATTLVAAGHMCKSTKVQS
ncbi:hypothetical protein [Shewanella algicola]|uniref:hypothetical protein n=1 Tax=Shewanella algicola TaxID=640633 RepID=UPI002494DC6D|nr:hypothetical protein [Shewanella algicola]